MGLTPDQFCIKEAFGRSTTTQELQILFCIWEDDVEVYKSLYKEDAKELCLEVDLNALILLQNYKATNFNGTKRGLQLLHIAALFSAHRILQEVLSTLQAEELKAMTSDSLTAVHISAALGDYLALRMLIEKHIPMTEKDSYGRTALHYAAQTNIESMVVLLTESEGLVKFRDQNGKTPLEYCNIWELRKHYKFLEYHQRQLSMSRSDDGAYEVNRNIQENLRTAPFLFDSYLCLRPQRGDGISAKEACNCHGKGEDHERFSAKSDLQALMKRRHRGFVLRPTSTFGQFESALSPVISQYIRIAQETKFEKIDNLLFNIWQLPKPELVLTFYGSDPKCAGLTKLLQRTLGKITRQTRTWLLTDGKLGGTAELVAQAMRGYTEAYGMKELQVIGLTPWALLANAECLRSDDFLGKTRFSLPQKFTSSEKGIELAENHTHYLLIDTKGKKVNDMIIFRTQFEAWISRRAEKASSEAQKVDYNNAHRSTTDFATTSRQNSEPQQIPAAMSPVCGILVGGDKEHLQQIKNALKQNIPFVVISDSGGLANVLERCVDMMKKKRASPDQKLRWSNLNMNLKKIADAVSGIWDLKEGEVGLLEKILNHAYLLEFISSGECRGAELDAFIVKSLTKSELFEGVDANEIWKFRLRMALQLNRTDFLSENMFAGVDWRMVPDKFVEISLLEDKRDFLQLLLDAGFPLHRYITLELIEKLYQADFETNKPRAEIFKILVSTSYKPMPKVISMTVVDTVLSHTLGHKFNKVLPKEQYKKKYKPSSFESSALDSDEEDGEKLLLQLLIWAFICRRFELSHIIWLLMKEPIPAALLLVNLAERMKRTQQALKENDELQRMALFYERMAVGILEECHSNDTANTLSMLCMARSAYGGRSQLILAKEGKCKHFIEHQASQTCVKRVWFGNISELISFKRYSFSIIMGIIFPPVVPLIVEYRENRQIRNPHSGSQAQNKNGDQTHGAREASRSGRKNSAKTYFNYIKDFYCAPQTRFINNFILSVLLIIAFSLAILLWRSYSYSKIPYIVIYGLFFGILLENIRSGIVKGGGFKQYLTSSWNLVFFACICLFILGNLSSMARIKDYPSLIWLTRLFFAIYLLVAFAFLFRFFVASRSIGPKLLMINKMVLGDLLPFLAIIIIFWLSFTVFLVAIIYKPNPDDPLRSQVKEFFVGMRNSFFAMFGEFNIDDNIDALDKLEEECSAADGCTYPFYDWSYPLVYAVYVLCTHVVLINLLIAMFTKRYSQMESESKQLWAMQQFILVQTFTTAPPLPPTVMLIWPLVCIYQILTVCCNRTKTKASNPFCHIERSERHERQLISWQKFCSLDFLRHNKMNIRLALEHPKFASKESREKGIFTKPFREEPKSNNGEHDGEKYKETQTIMETLVVLQNYIEELSDGLARVNPEAFQMLRALTPRPNLPVENPDFMDSTLRIPQPSVSGFSPNQSFRASRRISTGRIRGSLFKGQELNIAFFVSPSDEFISERVSKSIPWDVEPISYQPVVSDSADEGFLRWIGGVPEEPAEPPQSLPRNPFGRTGLDGRGRLPAFGENKAFYLVFTLDEKWDYGYIPSQSQSVRRQVLLRSNASGGNHLPWFICNHAPTEDKNELLEVLLLAYMQRMALDLAEREPESYNFHCNLPKELKKCELDYHEMGCLEDKVNCDNAWINVTSIHIQVPGSYRFWELLPQLFVVKNVEAKWESLSSLPPVRESHLQAIAVFNEKLIRA